MTKRLLTLTLAAMLLAAMLIPAVASADGATMYVVTDNKGSLNVRRDPMVAQNVIGRLNYGQKVTVRMTLASGWTCIDYAAGDGQVAYVQSRFLSWTMPGGDTPTPSGGEDITSLNAEFKSARQAPYPYSVVARPSRASGWVNLRWAPTTSAEVICKCYQGKTLTVLAETTSWYQAQDPETGMVGFIMKKFVSVVY